MKTCMLTKARRLWANTDAPKETNRANMREWVRAMRAIGDKWLMAKPVHRRPF